MVSPGWISPSMISLRISGTVGAAKISGGAVRASVRDTVCRSKANTASNSTKTPRRKIRRRCLPARRHKEEAAEANLLDSERSRKRRFCSLEPGHRSARRPEMKIHWNRLPFGKIKITVYSTGDFVRRIVAVFPPACPVTEGVWRQKTAGGLAIIRLKGGRKWATQCSEVADGYAEARMLNGWMKG
jgi:hypothetical protein